jgi:hypothetical protein
VALNVLGGNTPSIVEPIPSGIVTLPAGTGAFQIGDVAYDYAIAGIPFFAAESLRGSYFRRQYLRNFAAIRKDQFDNQQVPGEQSLWGWWLRSQSNFGQGAGILYLDTSVDQTLAQRYMYSEHLDVLSVPNQVQLLQGTKQILNSANTNLNLRGVNVGGTDMALVADGAVLKQITAAGTTTSYTMPGGISNIVTLTDDGTNYYFADTTGIYKGTIGTTGVAATKIWNVPSGSGRNVIDWVKGRLVAGLDNSVYELVGSGPTLPTAKFTHQNSAWTFTSIEDTPSSILVSGFAGMQSQIHRFTLDTGGALPTLSSGIVTADMPLGETINRIFAYLGAFVGIATSKGIRVATVDTNGNVIYGPLVVQNPNGVSWVTGYDRFLFFSNTGNGNIPYLGWSNPAAATGNSGLMRLDLSQNTSTGGYPYCSDLDAHTPGTVNHVENFGLSTAMPGMLVFSVSGHGVYVTDASSKETQGVMYTGRVRYNTLEAKHFKYVYLRTPSITDGSIQVIANDPGGGSTSILTQSTTTTGSAPTLIGTEGNQREWLQLQLVFNRGTNNNNVSPILGGYQLRALPGVDRQLMITLPLLCFDTEMDRENQLHGYGGSAMARLQALEAATASGNLVTLQDLNYGLSYLVIVDDYEFQQQANERGLTSSSGQQDGTTRGGFLILQCRVVQ